MKRLPLPNLRCLVAAWLLTGAPVVVYAIDSQNLNEAANGKVTREALKDILAPASLEAVVAADVSQDKPGSEGAKEKRRHFDGSALSAAAAYLLREQSRAVTLACEADSDPESRADALRHLGLMLHTAQDFYLHTNYVELQLEDPRNQSDVYNLPLVDWTRVPTGYAGKRTGLKLAGFDSSQPDDPLNKESATTSGGKLPVGRSGATRFDIACDLAERETKHQWSLFEVLVRTRCGSHASDVLASLRGTR